MTACPTAGQTRMETCLVAKPPQNHTLTRRGCLHGFSSCCSAVPHSPFSPPTPLCGCFIDAILSNSPDTKRSTLPAGDAASLSVDCRVNNVLLLPGKSATCMLSTPPQPSISRPLRCRGTLARAAETCETPLRPLDCRGRSRHNSRTRKPSRGDKKPKPCN